MNPDVTRNRIRSAVAYLQGKCRSDTTLAERVDWALEDLAGAIAALDAPREDRKRLPDEREAITRKFEIAGHDFYLTIGLYPDDHQPGEVFIRSAKEGSTLAGLLDTIGILLSLALQYHVPLKAITDKLSYSRFDPAGFTGIKGLEYVTSPVDAVVRWMAQRFLPAEAKPEPTAPMVSIPPQQLPTGDAPACERCGHLMDRMGSNNCFVCRNCAATSGSCGG